MTSDDKGAIIVSLQDFSLRKALKAGGGVYDAAGGAWNFNRRCPAQLACGCREEAGLLVAVELAPDVVRVCCTVDVPIPQCLGRGLDNLFVGTLQPWSVSVVNEQDGPCCDDDVCEEVVCPVANVMICSSFKRHQDIGAMLDEVHSQGQRVVDYLYGTFLPHSGFMCGCML